MYVRVLCVYMYVCGVEHIRTVQYTVHIYIYLLAHISKRPVVIVNNPISVAITTFLPRRGIAISNMVKNIPGTSAVDVHRSVL